MTCLVCSIPDCGKPHMARGWCQKHYFRFRRHGDPLGGAIGDARRYFEEVILNYDGDECLPWPFSTADCGYGRIRIGGRKQVVSRAVCERVNGPPPTPAHEAAHSCGKGHEGCCTKRHLRWATRTENQAERVAHGTNHIRGYYWKKHRERKVA